jgi:hypothetical protein
LVLFVRIGAFQWVTAIPNKKMRLASQVVCKTSQIDSEVSFLLAVVRARARSAYQKKHSKDSGFSKKIPHHGKAQSVTGSALTRWIQCRSQRPAHRSRIRARSKLNRWTRRDPKATFNVGPMDGREARESSLPRATRASRTGSRPATTR